MNNFIVVWVCGLWAWAIACAVIIWRYWGKDEFERNLKLITANIVAIGWNVAGLLLLAMFGK